MLFQTSELWLLVQAGFKGRVRPILACLGDTLMQMSVLGLILSHVRDIGKLGRKKSQSSLLVHMHPLLTASFDS